jgi:hypothetical protein
MSRPTPPATTLTVLAISVALQDLTAFSMRDFDKTANAIFLGYIFRAITFFWLYSTIDII